MQTRRAVLSLVPFSWANFAQQRARTERPLFSFAVITDVQYADKDAAGKRDYRRSLAKLEESAAALNSKPPAFVVQLGDLVDGGEANFAPILAAYNRIRAPKYHVLGNHDFCISRTDLLKRFGLASAWYDFAYAGWRFVVLDGMDVSVASGNEQKVLDELRANGRKNAADWNGGIGERQKAWLRRTLEASAQRKEPVIVLCHAPVLEESSTPAHVLWNDAEVLQIIDGSRSVVAWFNGHDHNGGYACRNGIHYVTFPGLVESGEKNSYTIVDAYRDRLELRGAGTAPNRTLRIR